MKKIYPAVFGTFLAAAAFIPLAESASAMPRTSPMAAQTADNNAIVDVEMRYDRRRNWDRRRDGDRCSYRNDRCRHYYRGRYYQNQWWALPIIIGGAIAADRAYDRGYDEDIYDDYGNSHVEWCLSRYRSYNPRNNLWLSYSGNYRQCVSPY